jgi:NADH-quinone oxidoreductase subunit G
MDGRKVAFILGDQADCETMVMVRELAAGLGSPHVDCRQDGAKISRSDRAEYLFNTTIAGIERADACLLVGTDPRAEAPLVQVRLRKRWNQGGFKVGRIGAPRDLTYPVQDLGAGAQTLAELLDDGHSFASVLRDAKNAMLILSAGTVARPDGAALLALARLVADRFGMVREDWNGFNLLHTAASRVGGLDLGMVPGEGGRDVAGILEGASSGEIEAVFLIGADEVDTDALGNAFVVYQGSHGDRGARAADVILPGAAYTEKNATYVNTEGRPQRASLAVFPPGEAKEDWKILRALSEAVGRTVRLDNLGQVRARMAEMVPHLARIDQITPAPWTGSSADAGGGQFDKAPFVSAVANYYEMNPITRASSVMRQCTEEIVRQGGQQGGGATGTHG